MPYEIVKTKEYRCVRCAYRWIARHNGVDKPKPKSCPKCKNWMWDKEPQSTWNGIWSKYRLRNSSMPEEQKQFETVKNYIRQGRIVI